MAGSGEIALQPEDQIRKAGAGGKYIVNMESRLLDPKGNAVTEAGVVEEPAIEGKNIIL